MSDPFSEYDPYFESEYAEHRAYLDLIREYWSGLAVVKALCAEGEAARAKDVWDQDFPEHVRLVLWRAPTRGFGSVFETWEREMLFKGDECFTMPVSAALKFWKVECEPIRRMVPKDLGL